MIKNLINACQSMNNYIPLWYTMPLRLSMFSSQLSPVRCHHRHHRHHHHQHHHHHLPPNHHHQHLLRLIMMIITVIISVIIIIIININIRLISMNLLRPNTPMLKDWSPRLSLSGWVMILTVKMMMLIMIMLMMLTIYDD